MLSLLAALVFTQAAPFSDRLRAVEADLEVQPTDAAAVDRHLAVVLAGLGPEDPGFPLRVCEALEVASRAGRAERVEAPLRRAIELLEADQPSYATLAGPHVTVSVDHHHSGHGPWQTVGSTLLPAATPCEQWDAAAARVALADSLLSRSMSFDDGTPPAQRIALERSAAHEYEALWSHAAAAAAAAPQVRAGLLDLSLVYCPRIRRPDRRVCPGDEAALRSALQLRSAALGDAALFTQQSALSLAAWLEQAGRGAEAEAFYRRVLPDEVAQPSTPRFDAAAALFALGHARGRPAIWQLVPWLARALEAPAVETNAPQLSFASDVARLAMAAKRPADAVLLLRPTVERAYEPSWQADLRSELAAALAADGQLAEADAEYARAITAKSVEAPRFVVEQQADRWREVGAFELARARVLDQLGRATEAAALRRSAARRGGLAPH